MGDVVVLKLPKSPVRHASTQSNEFISAVKVNKPFAIELVYSMYGTV